MINVAHKIYLDSMIKTLGIRREADSVSWATVVFNPVTSQPPLLLAPLLIEKT